MAVDQEAAKSIREAIREGSLEKVKALIEGHEDRLRMKTPFGTWLHVAASFGKLDIVKYLIAKGADVNAYGGIAGGGPLHRAAADGHIDVVRYLLDHGAALDVSEPERNPLFGAIYGGHADIVKLLMNAGIDTKIKYSGASMKNMDAAAFARERGRPEIEKMILAHGK